jgi:hypothetical protein
LDQEKSNGSQRPIVTAEATQTNLHCSAAGEQHVDPAAQGTKSAHQPFSSDYRKGAMHMADKTTDAKRLAREQQSGMTAMGMNALKPIMHFQVSLLRMWADTIERFAGNYQKGLDKTTAAVEEQSDRERAA